MEAETGQRGARERRPSTSSGSSDGSNKMSSVTTKVKISGVLSNNVRSHLISAADHDEISEASGHDHHHTLKPNSIATAIPSAVINFLLMFGLCSAYGLIMFPDEWHAKHRGLAVKMNLASAMGVGMALSFFSSVKVAIGGPDLNPVVFVGMFIESIAAKVAEKNGLALPDGSRRLLEVCSAAFVSTPDTPEGRRLAASGSGSSGGSAVEFCTGDHELNHQDACNAYHDQLMATTILTVMISTAFFGLIFFLLGKFKLTRYVSYLPTNIMEAFLSCVGYKVFKYAIKFCNYEPIQFIPAACIGVPLYFVKAMHLGNPAIVIPSMLLIPLGIFYIVLYSIGSDVDKARDEGWMFDYMENAPFYDTYTQSFWSTDNGFMGNVVWDAWSSTLGILPIASTVVVMDCLLKLHSTESKLPVKNTNKNAEMKLYGLSNILSVLTGGTVGYMQLKFNVINYGVLGNITDRRGGMLYAILIGVTWWGTTSIFNFMPRFFLSALLFFAGSGFVAENLWGSRRYLSTLEWMQILLILAIFILTESLLIAVIIGSMIIGASFIFKYAKVPSYHGPIMGGEIATTQRRNLLQQACVHHISNHRLMVFHLKGFIFFASAQNLLEHIQEKVDEFEKGVPWFKRLRWIIFDASELDNMDSSATKAFTKFSDNARKHDIDVWWCSLSDNLKPMFVRSGTIHGKKDCYENLNQAVDHCETEVTTYVRSMQAKLIKLHPRFELVQDFLRSQERFEPFREVLATDAGRVGCPWKYCGRLKVKKMETLIWEPGKYSRELFLVHSGKIGLFTTLTETQEGHEWGALVATYSHGWFLNTHSFFQEATQHYAVALEDGYCITWNEFQWAKLKRERPGMAAAILAAAMRQSHTSTEMIKLHHHHFKDSDSEWSEPSLEVAHSVIPPELQRTLECIDTVKELYSLGFYRALDSDGEALEDMPKMPKVPRRVVDDLEVAWLTYVKWFDSGRIPLNRVREALMYAGIFDVFLDSTAEVVTPATIDLSFDNPSVEAANARFNQIDANRDGVITREEFMHGVHDEQAKEVTKDEFMSMGCTAFMAKFNSAMIKTCEELFQQVDDDGNMVLDAEEVVHLFHDVLHGNISVEEVEGMLYLWGSVCSDSNLPCTVDLDGFVGLMARFVKRYEEYWHMLVGICELMNIDLETMILNDSSAEATRRQISGASQHSQKKVNMEDAEENTKSLKAYKETHAKEKKGGEKGDAMGGMRVTQITSQMLQDNAGLKAEEAQELLWVADCYGLGEGQTLDFKMVAATIMTNHTQPKSLPPLPEVLGDGDVKIYEEPDWGSKLVVEARDLQDTKALEAQMRLTPARRWGGNLEMMKYHCPHDGAPEYVNGLPDQVDEEIEARDTVDNVEPESGTTLKQYVHRTFEDPSSSIDANRLAVLIGLLIVSNVVVMVIEPIVRDEDASDTEEAVWFAVEVAFTAVFAIEYFIRVWAANADGDTRCKFMRSPLNICDLVALLPLFIDLTLKAAFDGDEDNSVYRLLRVLRLTRLARVIRIGRLAMKSAIFAPIAMIFVVIWGIYLKSGIMK